MAHSPGSVALCRSYGGMSAHGTEWMPGWLSLATRCYAAICRFEVDDALAISEGVDVWKRGRADEFCRLSCDRLVP
jgi:hypothetical protein